VLRLPSKGEAGGFYCISYCFRELSILGSSTALFVEIVVKNFEEFSLDIKGSEVN
jgi:hypothetical protein